MKRSEGKSSVAKAAYHARCRITDKRTGDSYDYSRRNDLNGHFILAPVNAWTAPQKLDTQLSKMQFFYGKAKIFPRNQISCR